MILLRSFSTSILTVSGAFGIAFLLISLLPSATFAALGIFSTNEVVASEFLKQHSAKGFAQYFAGALFGDFGLSLDGLPVVDQMYQAILVSFPGLMITLAIIVTAIYKVIFAKNPYYYKYFFEYLSFLPVYVFGILAGVLILVVPNDLTLVPIIVAGCAISVSTGALLLRQLQTALEELMLSDHVRFHRAQGASDRQIRQRISRNILIQLLPSVQSSLIVCITSLVFVELILGIGGIGSLMARAIKRSDTNLMLGLILGFALVTSMLQVLNDWIRHLLCKGEK